MSTEAPKFLKEYSKREHVEERNEVAAQIRAARAERREQTTPLSESAEAAVSTYRELGTKVHNLTTTGVNRAKELLSWVGVKKRLATSAQTEDAIDIPQQFEDPKKLLDDFYKSERERWSQSEGGSEEMHQLFTEEHLASLSMDEYALLLQRFPSAMVTHVVRQGIRDHTGMWEHTKGEGEYADGFMKVLQEGRLKSPLAVAATEHGKEEAIAKALKLDNATSREDAYARLEDSLSKAFDGYADRAAVHVATEEVGDRFYGSEKGNEIFVAFPSAHVAAEHQFIGKLATGGDTKNNDTWILQDDLDKGMDIDAGVVFIPAEAKVDPKTGSRYALDDLKRPIENSEVKDRIQQLLDSDELYSWLEEQDTSDVRPKDLAKKIGERFDVVDARLQNALEQASREIQSFGHHYRNVPEQEYRRQMLVDTIIEQSGMRFEEAEETVSSQEFWESYFAEHPEQRPSKVEYYKGDDPTRALLTWKERYGLASAGTESSYDLGTRLNNVSEYQSDDKDRFRSIAEKILNERYPDNGNQMIENQPEEQQHYKDEVIQAPPPPPDPFMYQQEGESTESWQTRLKGNIPPPPRA